MRNFLTPYVDNGAWTARCFLPRVENQTTHFTATKLVKFESAKGRHAKPWLTEQGLNLRTWSVCAITLRGFVQSFLDNFREIFIFPLTFSRFSEGQVQLAWCPR